MLRSVLCLLLCCCALWSADTGRPLNNPGFVHFYNNEYDQALADFEKQVQQSPNDPAAYNAVAQAILYREMYRDGALESQLVSGNNPFLRHPKMEVSAADRTLFANTIQKSLELSQAELAKDPKNISALYQLAVAHGLRANYLFLVEKAWMQALHESITGRKANDEILQLDPGFMEAHLIQGISEYTVGCLPGYLRVLGAMNGFHADKEDGIRQLRLVSTSDAANRFDASILLAAIYRRERRPQDALPLVKYLAGVFPRNYLFPLEEVQMYSDLGDKTSALKVLAQIDTLRRQRAPGYATIVPEKVQFARGNLLFWYGDLNGARDDLKQVTANTAGLDLSTAVMAWLRLGQVCDLSGDRSDAQQAYRETMRIAPKSEAALEAKSYIAKPYHRKSSSG